ncbi:MAG: hypothetical protein HY824_01720 [Acidobacteria bacterium]|nr:hypothetical protein [Acidobacteriota bacterium]
MASMISREQLDIRQHAAQRMRPVHVVWATATGMARVVIITVYEPNPEEWDNTFSRRRA